jgi:hypothetical protein
MQIGVEQDDCEGKDEDGVRVVELGHHVRIALDVPSAEHFHQSLDLLSFTRHQEVSLDKSSLLIRDLVSSH